ncbi:MAG: CRTAC1 family protein [Fuerstiella sp.]|nr:CRTAC1 family protein [Fuerstiella sp.]
MLSQAKQPVLYVRTIMINSPLRFDARRNVATFLVMAVLLSGCSKNSSTKPPSAISNEGPTVAAPETPVDFTPPSAETTSNDSARPEKPDNDTQQAVTQLPITGEFPSILFVDHEGHRVGRRDLHGSVCLAQVLAKADDDTKRQPSGALEKLTEKLKSTSSWKYTLIVNVLLDTAAADGKLKELADEGNQPADDHWYYWAPADETATGLSELTNKVILIDPVGRMRGAFAIEEAGQTAALEEAIEQLWNEQVPFLDEVLQTTWMDARRDAQLEQKENIPVQHDFQFRDVRKKSGIRFLHRIVDDAGSDYKGVHYDHGNGVTIADVDADGLTDVYFVNQLGENELYRNRGDGTFEDITSAAGVAVGDRVCVAASFVDIDNDGDADLYVTAVRKGNLLFLNDGHGQFTDATDDSGLGYKGHSSGAVFFDFDRDGLLDLFLCNVGKYTTEETGRGGYYVGFKDAFSGHLKPDRTELSRLYKNTDGKSFEDVTQKFGLQEGSWTGDAAACDLNNDGWPDLYVLDMQGNDEYYENQQGQGFVRKSRDIFPKTPWGAMGVAVADFDNDLDLDLFITDMHSDMSKDILADIRSEVSLNSFFFEEKEKATMKLPESLLKSEGASVYGNAFFRNDGDGVFTEISAQYNAENYWPWGLSSGDLNADGLEDAFVTSSMNYPYRYGVNSVMLNDGKQFHDAEFVLGVEPRAGGRTAQPWIQVDCAEAEGELMEKVVTGHQGEVTVWGSLGSRSSVFLDIDDDGDLDVITSEFNDVPLVLESNLAQRHTINYVKVRLTGKSCNRNGVGALLTIHAGEKKLLRLYDGKVGYLAQGIPKMYVGLGDVTQVESIDIVWPSGSSQTFNGPWATGETITLVEDD